MNRVGPPVTLGRQREKGGLPYFKEFRSLVVGRGDDGQAPMGQGARQRDPWDPRGVTERSVLHIKLGVLLVAYSIF